MSMCTVSFAAEEAVDTEQPLTYDVRTYEAASSLINSLLSEDVFGQDKSAKLTRLQFVVGAAKLFHLSELSAGSVYSDVKANSVNAGYVTAANAAGWIATADKFNPNDEITFAQAIKILLSAAEYQILADAKGGFPTGYLTVANEIDLLEGVSIGNDTSVTVAEATILAYNLMLAPVFEITSYGDKMDFKRGGKTYIEKLYEAYPVEGVVTATEHNSIVLNAPFKKDNGKIAIDGVEYKYPGSDISLLGKNVTAYCAKENTRVKKVYCVIPDENEEITITAKDYMGISGTRLSYLDGNKERKLDLDSAYKVIYNGRRVASLNAATMLRDNGATIRLLSNNGDDTYEFIFIDAYKYGIVTNVDYVGGYIGFKTPAELIDLSDDTEHVCYIRKATGESVELYELTKDTALAVKASMDNRIFDITVLPNSVTGTITGMFLEEYEIDLGDVTYKITKDFKENYIDTNLVAMGDTISAVIGMYGEIAYLISNSAGTSYGHLHDIYKDPAGFKPSAYVKIYTVGAAFQAYELAEKVIVDGVKKDRNEAYNDFIAPAFNAAQADPTAPVLVIKYSLDNENKVNMIDFASEDKTLYGKELDPQDSLVKYYSNISPSGGLYTSSSSRGISSKVVLESSTIMVVPENVADRDDETLYSTMSGSSLNTNYASQYRFDIYDIDELGNAGYAILYDAASLTESIIERNSTYIIEKIRKAIVDEEEGYNIQCWSMNKYETLFMPSSVTVTKNGAPSTLVAGDIVRFVVKNNKISSVAVDYDFSSGTHVFNTTSSRVIQNYAGGNATVFARGRVYSASGNTIVLRSPDAGMPEAGVALSDVYAVDSDTAGVLGAHFDSLKPYRINTYIACFDTATGEIRTIKSDSIRTEAGYGRNADKAILRLDHYGGPTCLIIIK